MFMNIIMLVVVWWTFAVVVFASLLNSVGYSRKEALYMVCVAMFWPVVGAFMLPAMTYSALMLSAKQIRADLKNRQLLREFEDWLDENKE